jgi:hypothetical protein
MAELPQLARVVKIIDPFTLVINKGSRHGVTELNHLVLFTYGDDLDDPETGEPLGKLEIVKGRGKVKHLQETMTTIVSATVRRQRPSVVFIPIGGTEPDYPQVMVEFDDPQVGDLVRIV